MSVLWDASFSVGIEAMDRQHRRILGLVSELRERVEAHPGSPVPEEILSDLTRYALEHFQEEEALLARHGYPDLEGQAEEHRAFVREVAAQCMGSFEPSGMVAGGLLTFLEGWWRHHILVTDMAYRDFLQARGVR